MEAVVMHAAIRSTLIGNVIVEITLAVKASEMSPKFSVPSNSNILWSTQMTPKLKIETQRLIFDNWLVHSARFCNNTKINLQQQLVCA